jgi:hypothetical protein
MKKTNIRFQLLLDEETSSNLEAINSVKVESKGQTIRGLINDAHDRMMKPEIGDGDNTSVYDLGGLLEGAMAVDSLGSSSIPADITAGTASGQVIDPDSSIPVDNYGLEYI